jgi:hypothetical protein
VTCTACDTAAQRVHWLFEEHCHGCKARGLARIFLRKGERGRRLRMAAEQAEITVEQVRAAWQADALQKETTT